ncbi:serine palmitoyltransferase component [Serendipita sp. 411]|nr:serine palmitoyltransferase component [Serendipita sp. 411]
MSSPIAVRNPSPTASIFNHKSQQKPRLAAQYLQAVSQADSLRRSSAASVMTGSTATATLTDKDSSITASTLVDGESTGGGGRRSGATTHGHWDEKPSLLNTPTVAPNSTQVFQTKHVEFGHCADERFRHISQHIPGTLFPHHNEDDPPYYILLSTYISYVILICIGHVRDFFGKKLRTREYRHLMPNNGYAALNSDFDSFYTRRLKLRIDDCFSRPVTLVPGRTIVLLDRVSNDHNKHYEFTRTHTRALNVSSYNYLGFAQATGGCADAVEDGLKRYGLSALASRAEGGTLDLHLQAEALVARFLGQEDSIIASMGFATNSATLPALVGKHCLVISDEYNHASIRVGLRLSGAMVRTCKHNDVKDLERVLREAISQGQPRTHRPWKKILVVVEGLYSMEGSLANIPAIVALKKRYKFYLYVDEAHSIGGMGPQGRGVLNYFHVNPKDVDIMMGTFTKSFGASGGYIAGSKALISALRPRVQGSSYAESITPAVLTQIVASMGSIMGIDCPEYYQSLTIAKSKERSRLRVLEGLERVPTAETKGFEHLGPAPQHLLPHWLTLPRELRDGSEGRERLHRLAFNARYLSRGLAKLGFIVFGHEDSPIIPMLTFNPGKMPLFSRMMTERKVPIVVVIVGYPAVPLVASRIRFCLSASHTKWDVDELLRACDEIGTVLDLKFAGGSHWTVEEVIERAVELVNSDD